MRTKTVEVIVNSSRLGSLSCGNSISSNMLDSDISNPVKGKLIIELPAREKLLTESAVSEALENVGTRLSTIKEIIDQLFGE